MFYTDPSIEYRQSIVEIKQRIFSTGYFYIHQEGLQTNYECCGPIRELAMPAMVSRMKAIMAANDNTFDHVVSKSFMCAGGIQGYDIDSAAVVEVLLATLTCALEEGGKCIAPPWAQQKHSQVRPSCVLGCNCLLWKSV